MSHQDRDDCQNCTVSNNTNQDCPIEPEQQIAAQVMTNVTISNNTLTWRYGSGQGNSCHSNSPSWQSEGCGAANHLAAGTTQDYSGCTYQNNVNQDYSGSGIQTWQYENNTQAVGDELLAFLARRSPPTLLMDFKNVAFLTSTTLGMLLVLRKELQRRGGRLVLAHLAQQVQEVFEATRLHELFEVLPDGVETAPPQLN